MTFCTTRHTLPSAVCKALEIMPLTCESSRKLQPKINNQENITTYHNVIFTPITLHIIPYHQKSPYYIRIHIITYVYIYMVYTIYVFCHHPYLPACSVSGNPAGSGSRGLAAAANSWMAGGSLSDGMEVECYKKWHGDVKTAVQNFKSPLFWSSPSLEFDPYIVRIHWLKKNHCGLSSSMHSEIEMVHIVRIERKQSNGRLTSTWLKCSAVPLGTSSLEPLKEAIKEILGN